MEIKNMEELRELLSMGVEHVNSQRNHHLNLMWFYIGADRKIAAIKEYRSATNASLHEAKTHVEHIINNVAPNISGM